MTDTFPPWYHGCMSADAASVICKKVGQNGAFLVRQSQGVKGAFTLSMFFEGEVYHHRIGPTSGNHVMLESTKKEFHSLEKLVQHYMSPSEEFMYPLTVAIYPSLVKQLNENNQNWKSSIPSSSSPVYVNRKQLGLIPRTPIPKPNVAPKPVTKFSVVPKPSSPPMPSPSPSSSTTSPSPSPSSSAADKECWPSPPPSISTKPVGPAVNPKPSMNALRRTRSDASKSISHIEEGPSQPTFSPGASFTTFKPTKGESQSLSKAATLRPRSCVFPSNDIELVFDIPDGSEDQGGGQPPPRRRTLSMDEIHRIQANRNHDYDHVTEQRHEKNKSTTQSLKHSSQNVTKSGHDKKSKFKPLKQFLNRIARGQQYPKNVANRKPEHKVEEKNMSVAEKNSNVAEGNNNQAISEDYTPILCKTHFFTTTDYSTSDNALNFKKGTEMAVKGVRIDGWWFCYNKSTQESGWVYMDYLKPKNEKWFEAKPVETTRDYEIYDQLNFGSDGFDSDSDDDNYCKYSFPTEDTNTGGNVEKSGESEVPVGTY